VQVCREWRYTTHCQIDMQCDQLLRRNAVAVLRMKHLMEIVQPLGIRAEQMRHDAHPFAFAHLALIQRVRLRGEGRTASGIAVRLADAQHIVHQIRRLIEQDDIVGQVHVPIRIDPLGQDHAIQLREFHRASLLTKRHRVKHTRMTMRRKPVTEMELADGLPPRERWKAMLAIAIAVAMSVLVTSIANIALPTIARDLNATPSASIWVVNAYQLAVTVTLLPFASIGDIHGHRRVYIWGLAVYTAASLLCALAPSLPLLVIGRVLQGFGGAGIMSVNGALVRFVFPRAALGRGIGFNALVVAGSSAAGPSVAAAIMSVLSWPWLFALQVPAGILGLWLARRYLPRTPVTGHSFDPLSAVLNAITFGLFITALDGIGRGQGAATVLVEFAVSIAVGWFFVHRQYSLPAPMLPVDLFRRPVFALSVATAICAHAAQLIAFVALPFYFQYVSGLSPIEIGVLITPWPAALVVMAPIAGRLADRHSAGLLGGFGLAVMTLGLLLVLFLPAPPSQMDVAWRLAICGIGFGFFQSPNNRLMIASAPRERAGAGSGMLSTSRLLGQTTGSALVALVFGVTHGGADAIELGTRLAIGMAAAFAGVAMVLSTLRVGRPQSV
jgi:MFS transporter, DHA2 family, multidrug resistance protein